MSRQSRRRRASPTAPKPEALDCFTQREDRGNALWIPVSPWHTPAVPFQLKQSCADLLCWGIGASCPTADPSKNEPPSLSKRLEGERTAVRGSEKRQPCQGTPHEPPDPHQPPRDAGWCQQGTDCITACIAAPSAHLPSTLLRSGAEFSQPDISFPRAPRATS